MLPSFPDVVVLAGGAPMPADGDAAIAAALDGAALTVAADGGIAHAHRLDRDVHVLVGDLDSVTDAALARARTAGTRVIRHPADKDATDLELALALVADAAGTTVDGDDARRVPAEPDVWVVGGAGGRTDHLVGHLLLLTAPRFAGLRLHCRWGAATLDVVRGGATVHGRAGDTVSLFALHGPADGVTTTGLRFPLTGARLAAGTTLGLSNRMLADTATVAVADGVVAVVRPGDP